jgi:hypothetical protein
MTRHYRRGDEHIYREIAGEHLLIALRRREASPLYALTPVAVDLWRRLEGWVTADALADYLEQRYQVTREVALADVEEFLGQLEQIRAVESTEDPA